jgi:hypothetical protein
MQLIRDYNQGFKKGPWFTDSTALGYPEHFLMHSSWLKKDPESYKNPFEIKKNKMGTFEDRKEKLIKIFHEYNHKIMHIIGDTNSFQQLKVAEQEFIFEDKKLINIHDKTNAFYPCGKL